MKYMILTHASQQSYDGMAGRSGPGGRAWTSAELAAMGSFMQALNDRLEASGELVETRALAAPVHTRRVAHRDGAPAVTDGPYAETEEVLAGYWIVDCASLDRATEIAAELDGCPVPDFVAAGAYADVRPIIESVDQLEV